MQSRFRGWRLAVVTLLALSASTALAQNPLTSLYPFKKPTPAADKAAAAAASQELTEKDGPWLIHATSFAGPNAEKQAAELATELHRKFKLKTRIHHFHVDNTGEVIGLGIDKYGEPRKFKHINQKEFDEVGVMIGDFQSVDDITAQKTLETIKSAFPEALDYRKQKGVEQRYAGLRYSNWLYDQYVRPGEKKKQRGPMGAAFLTRNPLLPDEMFVSKGLAPFVVEMNKDIDHSLLKNPKKYTVRIASFRGIDTLSPKKFEELSTKHRDNPKIAVAAEKAHKLTAHLRSKGVDAWEFHDETESIVCVGGFDEVATPRADGKDEINPAVHRIMNEYGAVRKKLPGGGQSQLQPRVIADVALDYQPIPVAVPQASIGATYAKRAAR